MLAIRTATPDDISTLKDFILAHGPNPWNHIPAEGVEAHVNAIASGEVDAVVAVVDGELVGVASYLVGPVYPQYEEERERNRVRGYIAEVVVHREHAGRGIGTHLLERAKEKLLQLGVRTIYIKRHEENSPSAGMMRKAGFEMVDVFDDPIRTQGSRRTVVERFRSPR